jgi:hypothetical protein
MWWDLVIDVFMPTGPEVTLGGRGDKSDPDKLQLWLQNPNSFKNALNESGWVADEVVAAGLLRQGKQPSMLGMITGTALIEILRPRRYKALPKEFTLAITADRVVAFAMSRWTMGEEDSTNYVVKIKHEEVGSWPRGSVRMVDGTLELAGTDRFPVSNNGDPSTAELIEVLG